MVTLENFKKFLLISTPEKPATFSEGVLTLRRKQGVAGELAIRNTLLFLVNGISYSGRSYGDNPSEISAGQNFVSYQVKCQLAGEVGNQAVSQTWEISEETGFTAENLNAISGGKNLIPGTGGFFPREINSNPEPSDDRLNSCLNLAQFVVMDMAGARIDFKKDVSPLIEEAVYLVAGYRFRNSDTQQYNFLTSLGGERSPEAVNFFRDKTYAPLMLQVDDLIGMSGIRNLTPWLGEYVA